MAAVEKSNPNKMSRLLTRSANTPPTSERMTIGAKEQAVTTPNSVDEPVSLNRYSGKANRKMALPKREMIWPITTRVKSRLKSFVCIKYLHYLDIKPTVGLACV